MTLSQYFGLMDIQARMLLKADAAKFKLGFLWWFLEPLVWVCVFYLVFDVIMDSGRRSGDFILFLATGKFAFIWFSRAVIQGSSSIIFSKGLLGKIDVPKSIFPMAAVHESLYRQSTIYLLLFAILILSGIAPTLNWLWMVPIVCTTYLLIVACALVGAALVCVLRDFQKFIPLGMTFLLFTSGIFWDPHTIGSPEKTELLFTLNPLAFLIDAHRQVLMYDTAPAAWHFAAISAASCAVIAGALWYLRRYSKYIALQVLS